MEHIKKWRLKLTTVSVIVTNFHQEKYLKECLESIENQTFADYDVLVIDDNEEGQSNLAHSRNNLIWTFDIGLSACRMKGVERTSSKYLLFLDADDKLHPQFLAKTVKVLEDNPKYSVCFTDTQHFDGANTYWEQPEYNFYSLLQNNFMCSCSLIKRNDFLACGGFDLDNFNYWEDYENWINMGSKGYYGKHLPEKLFYYRMHKESGTQSKRNEFLSPYYKAYIISKHFELYPREWEPQVKQILSQYPLDFMKWKPKEQEQYLKEKGFIT